MPVMNGLQATKLIRSFEETGNWNAARKAGIDPSPAAGLHKNEFSLPSTHQIRIPIIAVSNFNLEVVLRYWKALPLILI